MLQAYTDASVVDGHSIHSFLLIHGKEVVVKGCLKSDIKDSVQAEIVSIIMLLLECKKRKMQGVVINTDSRSTINHLKRSNEKYRYLIRWMKQLLQLTNGNLQWVNRKSNKKADKMCREARKSIEAIKSVDLKDMVKNPELVVSDIVMPKGFDLKKGREYTEINNLVNVHTLSEDHIRYLNHYYCSMVYKSKRKPIEDVINWNSEFYIDTSKKGRRYFIENYLVKNHCPEDIVVAKASHAFDFY